MKNFFKKLFVLGFVLLSIFSFTIISNSNTAFAEDFRTGNKCNVFLGLTTWDCNVPNIENTNTLKSGIWVIAANILLDISIIASYLVVGYVIYGGYLYMFSSGDPSKVASGKKTLSHAFIGLAVVILATIILNAIRFALFGSAGSFSEKTCVTESCVDGGTMIKNMINWVIGISGAVAIIFVFIGGIGYLTSSGDAPKLQKAKNTIVYALIGLAIVALAEVIVSVVSGIIVDAEKNANITRQTLIAKEYHED